MERATLDQALSCSVIGSPKTVRDRTARLRSFEITAGLFTHSARA